MIGGLRDWKEVHGRLLDLLRAGQEELNLDFDLLGLTVNPHYLRVGAADNQLPETVALMR